jgi:phosphonate transport system substrate-binding protein
MKSSLFRRLAAPCFAAILLTAVSTAAAQVGQDIRVKSLTLGLVFETTPNPVRERFRPLVEYVAQKLAPAAAIESSVRVMPNAFQLIRLLDEERVDFYIESPYPTYVINRSGAANMILRRWKSGMSDYRSVIVTRKGNGVTRLEDLRGKLIALEDPGSTSGYILPKLLLFNRGFKTAEKAGLDAKSAASEIGYIFAGTEKSVVDHVVQDKVAAGAISNDDLASLDEKTKSQLTILAESESLPRHLVSVRRNLPAPVVNRLKDILLTMDRDDQGAKILRDTDNTTKFDTLPGGEEAFRRRLMEVFKPRISK